MRRVAIACAVTKSAVSFEIKPNPDRGMELFTLADWFSNSEIQGSDLWIESAIMGKVSGVQTLVKLASTQGALMSRHLGSTFIVSPSSWKAGVVGNGSADKTEVAAWLKTAHRGLFKLCSNQDEVDAMCMSLYGAMVATGEIVVPVKKKRKVRK
jgi:Holliday junction resolvasome RuvABC endonuclease subunit